MEDGERLDPGWGPADGFGSATINGSATDTITVDTADHARSLTLSDPNATLNDDGASASLTIGGMLTMSNGTLNVGPYTRGVLAVGALNLTGGALALDGGAQLDLKGTLSQTGGTLTLVGLHDLGRHDQFDSGDPCVWRRDAERSDLRRAAEPDRTFRVGSTR